jgi:hypothetical protein
MIFLCYLVPYNRLDPYPSRVITVPSAIAEMDNQFCDLYAVLTVVSVRKGAVCTVCCNKNCSRVFRKLAQKHRSRRF